MTVETPAPAADPTPAVADAATAASASSSSAAPSPATDTKSESMPSSPAADVKEAGAKTEAKTPEIHQSEPSLLESAKGKDDKKSDAKETKAEAKEVKADAKADAKEPAPAEAAKAEKATDPAKDATQDTAPAPIKYDALKVPEGLTLDPKGIEAFDGILSAARVSPEIRQQLADLHVDALKAIQKAAHDNQVKVWNRLQDTWKTEFRNDKELGGNREETTLRLAKGVVELYGGTKEQQADLLHHISNNGMGNYVGFIRMLNNIGKALNVFEDGIVAANPTPPKAKKSPGNRGWYENMPGQAA